MEKAKKFSTKPSGKRHPSFGTAMLLKETTRKCQDHPSPQQPRNERLRQLEIEFFNLTFEQDFQARIKLGQSMKIHQRHVNLSSLLQPNFITYFQH